MHEYLYWVKGEQSARHILADRMELSQGVVRLEKDGYVIAVITLLPGESVVLVK
jgi:hypothetical protein